MGFVSAGAPELADGAGAGAGCGAPLELEGSGDCGPVTRNRSGKQAMRIEPSHSVAAATWYSSPFACCAFATWTIAAKPVHSSTFPSRHVDCGTGAGDDGATGGD